MTSFHFLNVGHGDCTFVDFDSRRLSMIDVNNSDSLPEGDEVALAESRGVSLPSFRLLKAVEAGGRSWEDYYRSLLVDPYEYYTKQFAGRSVFRYIQTHPDLDHMSGLARFFWFEHVQLENMWDTANTKTMAKADFNESPYDYNDWLAYTHMRDGRHNSGGSHKVLNNLQAASAQFWADDQIQILAPTQDLIDYCNERGDSWNNASYVLRVTSGGRRVILAGDAEKPAWDKIIATVPAADLRCDVLKAARHGRESGFSQDAVAIMKPKYVVCSVGKKPDTDASDEYAALGATVLSTRFHGSIELDLDTLGNGVLKKVAS